MRSSRTLIASLMLVVFASRALITPGFMPSSDRPFSLEICPEGFPAAMLVHGGHLHHHSGSPSQSEHCVFGTAGSPGPLSYLQIPSDISPVAQPPAVAFVSILGAVRLVRLPQPRAPPGQLS
jgi:hypothetical protein